MQRQHRRAHAPRRQRIHQRVREVQGGGGRRDRAFAGGEQGLVIGTVARIGDTAANIRRQRHRAVGFECLHQIGAAAIEPQHDVAFVAAFEHGGGEIAPSS